MPNRATEAILAGLFLAALLFLFFSKSLSPGQVLNAADATFSTPFFSDLAPQGFAQASNQLLFDQVYQFTPWRYFAWESIRQGDIPLWNPYSLSGTPFVATLQSAVFYPINLVLTILPFENTFVWSAILRLWIAGIFTYLLARRYRLELVPSLIAAVSFMLSGFLVVWLGHPHTNVAIWLPALVLLADILIQAHTIGKLFQATALLAIVVGIQFTGGHIETSVDVLFVLGLYYLIRWVQVVLPEQSPLLSKATRLLLFPALAVILGTGLAAIQLVPFIEWLSLSSEIHQRISTTFRLIDTGFWKDLLSLPTIAFPNIFNNPTWNYPYLSFLPWGNYLEYTTYVGVLTLVFAIVAFTLRRRDEPLIQTWTLIGGLSLGMALRLPIFDWLNQVPGLSLATPGRLRLTASFALCLLAGFGMQALWDVRPDKRVLAEKLCIRLSAAIAVVGLVIATSSGIVLPLIKDRVIAYGRHLVDIEYANRTTHTNSLDYYYAEVDKIVDGLSAAFRPDNLAMYFPALIALAAFIILIWSKQHYPFRLRETKVLFLFLVVVDLFIFGRNLNPSISANNLYPVTAIASRVAQDRSLFRFTALRQDLIPDANMMFRLADVRGLDFPTLWYNEYLDLVPDRIPWLNYGAIFASADSPLLRVLNIKYIVASQVGDLKTSKNVRFLQKQGDINLWEVTNVQPRSFMVYDVAVARNDDEALQMIKDAPDAIYQRVVLSQANDVSTPHDMTRNSGDTSANNVSLVSYSPKQSIWSVVTDQDGYLVASDAYYPGWQAYLDGRSTVLYRANVAFRAVYVPKGEHVVAFRYEPLSVVVGAITGLVAALAVLSMLIWARRRLSTHNE